MRRGLGLGLLFTVLFAADQTAPVTAETRQTSAKATAASNVEQLGTIGGRVVDGTSQRPVRSVQVRIQRGAGRPEVTVTDDEGRYRFEGLKAGRYTVAFLKGGFVSVKFGQRHQFDDIRTIELSHGQVIGDADCVMRAGGAIEGRVVDDRGEPLVEATVNVLRIQYAEGQRSLGPASRPATTDDRGQYRLWGLPSGEYLVAAAVGKAPPAQGGDRVPLAPVGFAPTYFPSVEDVTQAQRVTVVAGSDTSSVDIMLRHIRLARVSGTVSLVAGALGSGAGVSLWRARSGAAGLLPAIVGAMRVGRDGRFSFADVPPGDYLLKALSTSMPSVDSVATTGRLDNRTFASAEFGTQSVSVYGEDVSDVVITIGPAGRVRGQVSLDGQTDVGRRLIPLSIVAIPAGMESQTAGPTEVPVGDGGDFEIAGLLGRFVLRLWGLPADVALDAVRLSSDDITDSGVDVRAGDTTPGLDVRVTSHVTRLTGRVVAEDSGPLDGCTVVLFPADRRRWTLPSPRYLGSVRADADGAFSLSGFPPGPYLAVAVAYIEKGQWRDPEFLAGAAEVASSVTLWAGQPEKITLTCHVK